MFVVLPLLSFQAMANQPAQNENSSSPHNNSQYPAAFFVQYQPQNAMDMIQKLPGFSFDGGDNARGFGGNAGNVLIDGSRPTSKSGGLWGALQRIPAAQVKRIEILRGGVSAGEASGQSIVANVIKHQDVTSGTWALKFRRSSVGVVKPNLEAAITTKLGDWNGAFDIDLGEGPNARTATITEYDATDTITVQAKEKRRQLGQFAFTNGQMDKAFEHGKLTLNGRLGTDTWQNNMSRDITDFSGTVQQWLLNERNIFKTAEFGIDWVQGIDDWKWHGLAIYQIENRDYRNNANALVENDVTNTSYFSQEKRQQEFIIRNTYGYAGSNKFKPEFGLELANNTLDAELDYIDDGVEQVLDNANVKVEELRGELFASFVYGYAQDITLEGGLTAEFSQIKVSGENAKKQNFDFVKPRIAANYQMTDNLSFSLEAQHTVGQLNFNDFAASSSAEDDRDVSGNSDLVPEQVSKVSATMDWGFSEKGSVKFDIYHHWHSDILEEIELESGGAGVGNAGDSTMWGFDTNINLPIDDLLDNGLIEIIYNYRDTEFFDRIINRHRKTSYYIPHNFRMKFRQDLTEQKVAWGMDFYNHFTDTAYYVDELTVFSGNDRVRFFIETTYFADLKVQLEVENANTGEFTRTRTFYEGDRSGAYVGKQISERVRKPSYKLSIWGTF